jgi:hypothetical protein
MNDRNAKILLLLELSGSITPSEFVLKTLSKISEEELDTLINHYQEQAILKREWQEAYDKPEETESC